MENDPYFTGLPFQSFNVFLQTSMQHSVCSVQKVNGYTTVNYFRGPYPWNVW